jgi:hypothetical protein
MTTFYGIVAGSDSTTNSSTAATAPDCQSASDQYAAVLGWMDLFNSTIMPFFTMFICTIIVIRCLIKSRKKVSGVNENHHHYHNDQSTSHQLSTLAEENRSSRHVDFKERSSIHVSTGPGSESLSNGSSLHVSLNQTTNGVEGMSRVTIARRQARKSKSREEREFQFAAISIMMNVLFFFFNICLCSYNLISSYVQLNPGGGMIFQGVGALLFFCNFSYKFFLYLAINTKFRSELLKIFPFSLFKS